jgi:hypothetical protein
MESQPHTPGNMLPPPRIIGMRRKTQKPDSPVRRRIKLSIYWAIILVLAYYWYHFFLSGLILQLFPSQRQTNGMGGSHRHAEHVENAGRILHVMLDSENTFGWSEYAAMVRNHNLQDYFVKTVIYYDKRLGKPTNKEWIWAISLPWVLTRNSMYLRERVHGHCQRVQETGKLSPKTSPTPAAGTAPLSVPNDKNKPSEIIIPTVNRTDPALQAAVITAHGGLAIPAGVVLNSIPSRYYSHTHVFNPAVVLYAGSCTVPVAWGVVDVETAKHVRTANVNARDSMCSMYWEEICESFISAEWPLPSGTTKSPSEVFVFDDWRQRSKGDICELTEMVGTSECN